MLLKSKKNKQPFFFNENNALEETENKHAMRGIIWGSFNTFILTQAGRRRATHFVKLVSSQVKKIEKWPGLAIKQLTSYCVPSPEQMKNETRAGMTPVPRPVANRLPHCVIVWGRTRHAWSIIGQHAAGWFHRDTRRRRSVHQMGLPQRADTDSIQTPAWDLRHMEQKPRESSTKQGTSFRNAHNKHHHLPLPPSYAHLFLG